MRKTHKQYVIDLLVKNPNAIPMEEYKGAYVNILHKFNDCGHIYKTAPHSTCNKKRGCPICANNRKKTQEQYNYDLEKTNANIIILGNYISSNSKALHKCLICEHEWEVLPTCLTGHQKQGCPKCSNQYKRTYAEFINDAEVNHPNIEILEIPDAKKRIAFDIPIDYKCKICSNKFNINPYLLLRKNKSRRKYSCPYCAGVFGSEKLKKTQWQYKTELTIANNNITIIGKYVNIDTKTLHKCKICQHEFDITPYSLLKGSRCPKCSNHRISKSEAIISKILDTNKIKYQQEKTFNDCKDKKALRFDFYLPDKNIAIEYHGQQHFYAIEYWGGAQKLKGNQRRDAIKAKYCANNNIILVVITYKQNVEAVMNKYVLPSLIRKRQSEKILTTTKNICFLTN